MIAKISDKSSSAISVLDVPKFKRKSNEEQFKLNAKVIQKIEGAHSAVESEDLSSAKEAIIQARDMLKHRQKLVLLADTSDLGWRLVSEYEANPIASDSDDEKRIYKAEARASRKAKADKTKKPRKNNWPYKRPEASGSAQASQGIRQRPGLCFSCGKAGHWKNECTQNSSYQNNKLSSYFEILDSVKVTDFTKGTVCQDKSYLSKNETLFKAEKKGSDQMSDKGIVNSISPVGRLRQNKDKWCRVSYNQYILDVVENGYKLPFKNIPESAHLKNNRSALENKTFVRTEIKSLLEKRVISEVLKKPIVVNPLTVAYNKAGKPRLVLDCRHVNPCLHMFKIKFEDINTAESLFDLNTFVYTFDLKSAYHHIDIFPEHTTYLGFSWIDDGVVRYYVYNSLPFGIASAGHIFTKTLRVLIKHWRSLGHRVIMFLDDGVGGHAEFKKAMSSSNFIHNSLIDLGFLLAEEKCCWNPSQIVCWLGHILNYRSNCMFISEERILRLEMSLKSVKRQVRLDTCKMFSSSCRPNNFPTKCGR
ncbi:uncharacterized protein LOC123557092 isoform X1 [Mercenaria mercenaria]|uniref:uncharacterized protein LOC123557092 isoform X1 n=1 Tax=Mercenaria mercenaria TaxID=6596 RepID=UPI00234EE7AE|nr:uncharacterized protein LOC123557092 isoform X1 [Mercenaria mercenaria]